MLPLFAGQLGYCESVDSDLSFFRTSIIAIHDELTEKTLAKALVEPGRSYDGPADTGLHDDVFANLSGGLGAT